MAELLAGAGAFSSCGSFGLRCWLFRSASFASFHFRNMLVSMKYLRQHARCV
jgi:hypothetical protein